MENARRLETEENTANYPTTVEERYSVIHFQVIDQTIAAIKDRFDQKAFQMLKKLETVPTSSENPNDTGLIRSIITFFPMQIVFKCS